MRSFDELELEDEEENKTLRSFDELELEDEEENKTLRSFDELELDEVQPKETTVEDVIRQENTPTPQEKQDKPSDFFIPIDEPQKKINELERTFKTAQEEEKLIGAKVAGELNKNVLLEGTEVDVSLDEIERLESSEFNLNSLIKASQDKQTQERLLLQERVKQEVSRVTLEELDYKQSRGIELTPIEKIFEYEISGRVDKARILEMTAIIAASIITGGVASLPTLATSALRLSASQSTAAGTGILAAIELIAIDAIHKEEPLTPKEVATDITIGVVGGGGLTLVLGRLLAKTKGLAKERGLSVDELNAILNKEANKRKIKLADYVDEQVAKELELNPGAEALQEFIKAPPLKSGGFETLKSSVITEGAKAEGGRIAGVPREDNLIVSGMKWQSPRTKEIWETLIKTKNIDGDFISPQTIKALNEEIKSTTLVYNRIIVPHDPPIIRKSKLEAKPTSVLVKKVADDTGDSVGKVMHQATLDASLKGKGKTVKEVLVDEVDKLPTDREATEKILKKHTAEYAFEGSPKAINATNKEFDDAIEEIMQSTKMQDFFKNLTREVTVRKGDTKFIGGNIKPHVQAIANRDIELTNILENFVEIFKEQFSKSVRVTMGQVDDLVAQLPNSAIAAMIKSPQRTLDMLMDAQIRVAAVAKYSDIHFKKIIIPALRKMQAGGDETGEALLDTVATQLQMFDHVTGGGSGFGRGLEQMKHLGAAQRHIKEMTKRIDDLFRKGGKVNKKRLENLIEDLNAMPEGEAGIAIAQLSKASGWDIYRFIMKNGMLSGTATQEKNFFGNIGLFLSYFYGEVPLTAIFHGIPRLIRGQPREKFLRETVQAWYAFPTGFKDGWGIFWKKWGSKAAIDPTTLSKFNIVTGGGRVYVNPVEEISFLSKIGNVPRKVVVESQGLAIRMLDAVDGAFKELNTAMGDAVLAYRYARIQAQKKNIAVGSKEFDELFSQFKNLRGMDEEAANEFLSLVVTVPNQFKNAKYPFLKSHTEEIKEIVLTNVVQQNVSQRITLAEAPGLAKFSRSTQKHLEFLSDPVGSANELLQISVQKIPYGDLVVPFLTAPLNLFKWTIERTPISGQLITAQKLIARSATGLPLKLDEELAKAAMGFIGTTAVAHWLNTGFLTGGFDTNPRARGINKLQRTTNFHKYSINFGGYSIPLIYLEPWGPMLMVMTDFITIARREDLDADAITSIMESWGNIITKKSTFQAMAFLYELGSGDWDRAKDTAAFMLVGNLVPMSGLGRTIGRAVNVDFPRGNGFVEDVMNFFIEGEIVPGQPRDVRGARFVDQVINNLPILRASLPVIYDTWGREVFSIDSWAKTILENLPGEFRVENELALKITDIISKLILPLPSVYEEGKEPIDLYMREILKNLKHDEKFTLAGSPEKATGFTQQQYADFKRLSGQAEMKAVLRHLERLGPPDSKKYQDIVTNLELRQNLIKNIASIRRKERKFIKSKFIFDNKIGPDFLIE